MRPRFTLAEMMTIVVLVGVVAAMFAPSWLRWRIKSNETRAVASMRSIAAAEAALRAGDLDRNGVGDYWTGDVAGLYCITVEGRPIALIDRRLAAADVYRYSDGGGTYAGDVRGGAVYAPSTIGARRELNGYWFQLLVEDEQGNSYAQDTDGRGACHNSGQFGFGAVPAEWGATGEFTFIINNIGAVYRRDRGWIASVPHPGTRLEEFQPQTPFGWPEATAGMGRVE